MITDESIRQAKVLIVDDKPQNLDVLIKHLEGFNISVALNGEDALRIAEEITPDIILLDVMMEGLDGYDTCRKLKEKKALKDVPVIFITALMDVNYKLKGFSAGGVDYITKPPQFEEVVARLKTHITIKKQRELLIKQAKEIEQAHKQLKKAHKNLASKNEALKKLNEQKNQFLGMAAHDMRTPLGVILGYSRYLYDMCTDHKPILSTIESNSQFMLSLIDDLLDISKIESGKLTLKFEKKNILPIIAKRVQLNRTIADKKDITIKMRCKDSIPSIHFDVSKMEQVLDNLLSNAIKFSFPNTQIELSVTKQRETVLITIKDQGQGIPSNELDKLFQPFSQISTQTTAGEKSTGLGLAIVKKIVTGHNGKIWVESEVNRGSTFFVSLPLNTKEKL